MILQDDKDYYVECLMAHAYLDEETARSLVNAMDKNGDLKAAYDHWFGCIEEAMNTMDVMLEELQ
jgi:hypothetical protein